MFEFTATGYSDLLYFLKKEKYTALRFNLEFYDYQPVPSCHVGHQLITTMMRMSNFNVLFFVSTTKRNGTRIMFHFHLIRQMRGYYKRQYIYGVFQLL